MNIFKEIAFIFRGKKKEPIETQIETIVRKIAFIECNLKQGGPQMDQQKKIEEMIENIVKLTADVKEMREALEDIKKGTVSINQALNTIEKAL